MHSGETQRMQRRRRPLPEAAPVRALRRPGKRHTLTVVRGMPSILCAANPRGTPSPRGAATWIAREACPGGLHSPRRAARRVTRCALAACLPRCWPHSLQASRCVRLSLRSHRSSPLCAPSSLQAALYISGALILPSLSACLSHFQRLVRCKFEFLQACPSLTRF